MKRLFFYLFVTIVRVASFGQSEKDQLTMTIERYFTAVEQKDNKKTLDFIYPKLFDLFPKDSLLNALDKIKADTTSDIALSKSTVHAISDIIEIERIKYASITYSFRMTMTFKQARDVPGNSDEKATFNSAEFAYKLYKEKFGDKNVTYDPERQILSVNMNSEMYSIKDPAFGDWKFLEKTTNMQALLEKLIPKKVLTTL